MKKISTGSVNRDALKDIRDIEIDTTKPCDERIKQYIKQTGNPYCYLDDGVVVEIGYADTQVSLHDRLLSYASGIEHSSGSLW